MHGVGARCNKKLQHFFLSMDPSIACLINMHMRLAPSQTSRCHFLILLIHTDAPVSGASIATDSAPISLLPSVTRWQLRLSSIRASFVLQQLTSVVVIWHHYTPIDLQCLIRLLTSILYFLPVRKTLDLHF